MRFEQASRLTEGFSHGVVLVTSDASEGLQRGARHVYGDANVQALFVACLWRKWWSLIGQKRWDVVAGLAPETDSTTSALPAGEAIFTSPDSISSIGAPPVP